MKNLITFAALLATCLSFLSVDSNTNLLRDENNRIRVMHGLNVVYK